MSLKCFWVTSKMVSLSAKGQLYQKNLHAIIKEINLEEKELSVHAP